MSVPKNHHYIPQFFMSPWCFKDKIVYSYALINGKIVCREKSAKSVCSEENLYTLLHQSAIDKQIVEKTFYGAAIDDPAAKVRDILLDIGPDKLDTSQRRIWSRFIVSFLQRAPNFIKELREEGVKIVAERIMENGWTHDDKGKPETLSDAITALKTYESGLAEDLILQHGLLNFDSVGMIDDVASMYWSVINVQSDNYELVTGDAPLIGDTSGQEREIHSYFLSLSPEKIFVSSTHHSAIEDFEFFSKNAPNRLIKSINTMTVRRSRRFVISKKRGMDNFIVKHINRHYSDPNQVNVF